MKVLVNSRKFMIDTYISARELKLSALAKDDFWHVWMLRTNLISGFRQCL